MHDDKTQGQILLDARQTIRAEALALEQLADSLGEPFVRCAQVILGIGGHVAVCGMGKSGHIARKIAATLSSTGTPAYFIHPAEASHGDLGMMKAQDALLVLSNSGRTAELGDILLHSANIGVPVIAITSAPESPLAKHSDIVLRLPRVREACPLGSAPMTSTTMTLALGDALAVVLMRQRNFSAEDFRTFHPGGNLGVRLLKAKDIMHTGDEVPLVTHDTLMSEAILVMTAKRMGCVGVTQEGKMVGVITDGDLRRKLHGRNFLKARAGDVMTKQPRVIGQNTTLEKIADFLSKHKITNVFVGDARQVHGIIHIHDIYPYCVSDKSVVNSDSIASLS